MTVVTMMQQGRPYTRADLESVPDDGHRYELIDGTLLVTPAPRWQHQDAVGQLHLLLHAHCPRDLKVFVAAVDVVLAEDTVLQPDLLVTRRTDLGERDLPAAPLLAIEVLSPSTRLFDLNTKKARYEEAGCASYWAVDPDEPALTAWDLVDGRYTEVAQVSGDASAELRLPFPVTVVPSRLRD